MDIKPFRGYRPVPELAAKVAIIPNNLMNEPDRRRAAKNNAYSFAHIAKPRIDFSDDVLKSDLQPAKLPLQELMCLKMSLHAILCF